MANWKSKIWRTVMLVGWCLAGAGLVALLIAAVSKKEKDVCKGYEVRIHGASEQLFLDKAEIVKLIAGPTILGMPVKEIDLRKMEEKLEKHAWIKGAQLFIDNNNILRINVEEREPIARIFTEGGNTFYIDSSCEQLPLTETIALRLPVFTGFPSERIRLNKADRALMQQIKQMSGFLNTNTFWGAQIAQVDITPQRQFEMVPTIGNHIIEFGDGNDIENKFRRLFVFYQQVMSKSGLSSYERVNVQFARQVIGKKKGVSLSRYDSLQAVKKIKQMIAAAQRMQPDTVRTNVKPLETSTMSENQLRNYDLVPVDTTRNLPNRNK
jgi:cell division protein FtsQ